MYMLHNAIRHVQGKLLLLLFILSFLFSFPPVLHAQPDRPLDKKIEAPAGKWPLARVLLRIRKATGVRLTYNTELIDQQPKVVVGLIYKNARDVLTAILCQTNLRFIEAEDGSVLIVPKGN